MTLAECPPAVTPLLALLAGRFSPPHTTLQRLNWNTIVSTSSLSTAHEGGDVTIDGEKAECPSRRCAHLSTASNDEVSTVKSGQPRSFGALGVRQSAPCHTAKGTWRFADWPPADLHQKALPFWIAST